MPRATTTLRGTLLALSLAAAAPAAAGAQAPAAGPPVTTPAWLRARLDGRFDVRARAALERVIDSALVAGVPAEPLVDKALEGASKGAPTEAVLRAVRGLAGDLTIARQALGANTLVGEMTAGAAALRAGVEPGALRSLRRDRPGQPLVVALGVLTDLIARGVPVDGAARSVLALTKAGIVDEQLVAFRRDVERDIGIGAPPAVAVASASTGSSPTAASATGCSGARRAAPAAGSAGPERAARAGADRRAAARRPRLTPRVQRRRCGRRRAGPADRVRRPRVACGRDRRLCWGMPSGEASPAARRRPRPPRAAAIALAVAAAAAGPAPARGQQRGKPPDDAGAERDRPGLPERLRRQVSVSVDAGAASVTYDEFLSSSVLTVTPTVRIENARALVVARSSFSRFESGNRSVQTSVNGSLVSPEWFGVRAELFGTAGRDALRPRAGRDQRVRRRPRARRLAQHRVVGGARGSASCRRATCSPTRWGSSTSAPGRARPAHLHGHPAAHARGRRALRRRDRGRAVAGDARRAHADRGVPGRAPQRLPGIRAWAEGWTTLWLARRVALVGGAGLFPFDPVQGLPGGRYVTAALRLATRRPIVNDPSLRAELLLPYEVRRLRSARAEQFVVEERDGGARVLRVLVPGRAPRGAHGRLHRLDARGARPARPPGRRPRPRRRRRVARRARDRARRAPRQRARRRRAVAAAAGAQRGARRVRRRGRAARGALSRGGAVDAPDRLLDRGARTTRAPRLRCRRALDGRPTQGPARGGARSARVDRPPRPTACRWHG
jgi:hypothetical protein